MKAIADGGISMAEYLIGIDAGCTSSKAVIFDTDGRIIASAATPSMRFKKRRLILKSLTLMNYGILFLEQLKSQYRKQRLIRH